MKATLEFELPQEREDFELAQKGWQYHNQLEEIWQQVFRPLNKHGYANKRLDELANTDIGRETIEMLAKMYLEITRYE